MHLIYAALPFLHSREKIAREKIIGGIFLCMMVLATSTSTPFGKQLTSMLPIEVIIFYAEVILLLSSTVTFGLVTLFKELSQLTRKQLWPLLFIGLMNGIIAPLILFQGLSMTRAVNAELFLRSNVLIMFVFSMIFLHEKIDRKEFIGAGVVFAGVLTVALRGFESSLLPNTGDMLVLVSTIMYATGYTVFKKYLTDIAPELVLVVRGLLVVVTFGAFFIITETAMYTHWEFFTPAVLPALIGYAFFARFLFQFSFYEAMEYLPAHVVSLGFPVSMVGSIFFAHLYLGEQIYWYHILGGGLIILGIALMQMTHIDLHPRHVEAKLKMEHKQHL